MRSIFFFTIVTLAAIARCGFAQTTQPGHYNLDGQPPYMAAHYMMWFSAPWSDSNHHAESWAHWAWKGGKADHNPNNKLPDGHRDIASILYPAIGPYDSGSRAVIRYHLATMRAAGVSVISSLWYGPGSSTDLHFPMLLEEAAKLRMRAYICYEEKINFPGYRNPKSRDGIVKSASDDLSYIITRYGQAPAYLRRDGIPVIQQFNAFGKDPLLGNHNLSPEEWKEVFAAIPGRVEYIRQNLDEPYHPPIQAAYVWWDQGKWPKQFAERAVTLRNQGRLDFFMTMVCPGFNDTGVWGWGNGPRVSRGYGIDVLDATMHQALVGNPELVQLVTWNDFNEGTCFEPTVQYGSEFLKALGNWWHDNTGKEVHLDQISTAMDQYKKECSNKERAEIP
jgi:hypothetical protein